MKTICRSFFSISFVFCAGIGPAVADISINSWTKPGSGSWEEQAYWSLGVLPDATQSVMFTNAGWKALAIGAGTAQNFPGSMQIQQLQIASPPDSYNVLLMNFSGSERPLQAGSVMVGSNSAMVVQSSAVDAGNLVVGGSFNQGDYSQVTVHNSLEVYSQKHFATDVITPGAYFLTNGTLTVEVGEYLGGMGRPGQFVQYGGWNNVVRIVVSTEGEYDLYGGQATAYNGIIVGVGDYAAAAWFYQAGGSVNADTVINGNYLLEGGTLTGRMSVADSGQRVNGTVTQKGGTNSALSMELGHPNRFGGGAVYVLSNGVVQVASSTIFSGGWFTQYGGQHTIVSNLVMHGTFVGPGNVYADYTLSGGTLSVGGLTAQTAHFTQDGGTNLIAGDLFIGTTPATPPQAGSSHYTLAGGSLLVGNVIVNVNNYGGFRQTGGFNQITGQLTVSGITNGFLDDYTLEGGTLAVKDIYLAAGAFFQHTSGNIIHSGVLILNQGDWHAAAGDHALGPLQSSGTTSSAMSLPDGSSILRLANSSAQAWSPSATLYINNWHGSVSGGGATQLFFGSTASGLTTQQLARIKFDVSGGLYPARILATGEVVPEQIPLLSASRSGNALTLTWGPGWTLQSSTNVTDPYVDVPGATSPYTFFMGKPREFFRLRQ